RVPTFTDLYYADPTTLGNENLVAESATSLEWGFRYAQQNISASAAVFTRKSTNLIDYVKEKEAEKFQAQNIQELQTSGVELSVDRFSDSSQTFTVGYGLSYTYIAQRLSEEAAVFSRYSIDNDLKHQLIVRMNATMSTKRIADFNLRYIERASGRTYTILDAHLSQQLGNFRLQASLNNLLNQAYWETSLISMPGRNVSFSLGYSL
ncbi:MAG: TonB-dependent receptor domain-containing protein, partial [Flavobacteriaceae bacterium]